MKNLFLFTSITLLLCFIGSCAPVNYQNILQELEELPPGDYSFAAQPIFEISKEDTENKLGKYFEASELKIGTFATFKYNDETMAQEDEEYWLKSSILNSKQIKKDLTNDNSQIEFARSIAEKILPEIKNLTDYSQIEVVLIQVNDEGLEKKSLNF